MSDHSPLINVSVAAAPTFERYSIEFSRDMPLENWIFVIVVGVSSFYGILSLGAAAFG